ncbi:MAG TPA: amidohydrolase family protein [Vicinamibacterales bacterium]|jgi:cytosine/adenosine deaminase-related metal-dependent hydrolase
MSARVLRARWLLPIDRSPIENGWVELARDRIVRLGAGRAPLPPEDLGDVALLPGLVNAHTHLELSWLRGRVPQAGSMVEWIRGLLAVRAAGPDGGENAQVDATRCALQEMHDTGTVLAGDVTNSLATPVRLRERGMAAVVFHELLGFNVPGPIGLVREAWRRVDETKKDVHHADLSYSVVAHAPYSVSPALFSEIARQRRSAPLAVHLGESPEEVEFLRTGRGPFRDLLESLGAWADDWRAPECDPVEYLSRVGYLRSGLVAVHGVHLTDDSLLQLRNAGATIVTCPRSNEWVGAGLPRLSHFYGCGLPVAMGTDSLASTASLNMFDELAAARRIAPDVSAAGLLESATRRGARALGYGDEFGTLAPGKRAALVTVQVPAGVGDVEEYLVSGVPASSIRRAA